MRGSDVRSGLLFSYVDLEQRARDAFAIDADAERETVAKAHLVLANLVSRRIPRAHPARGFGFGRGVIDRAESMLPDRLEKSR